MDEEVKVIKSRIGGQALIEGVMMRGITHTAMAVRKPDGDIDVSIEEIHTGKGIRIASKIPIVRGVVMFVQSIVTGYRYLAKSAEISGMADEEDSEPESKFEQWLTKVFGEHLMKVLMGISMVLGLALCILLFILVPALIVKGIDLLIPLGVFKSILEGIIKMAIFIGYLVIKIVIEYFLHASQNSCPIDGSKIAFVIINMFSAYGKAFLDISRK